MGDIATTVLVVARLLLFGLGAVITAISFRAYRRTGARYMRDASVGFGIMTVGVFIEGVLYEIAGFPLVSVHIVETVAIGLAFIILLVSLHR